MGDPLLDRERLDAILAPRREAGERIVFTNGCFDLLHAGHARLLEQARALGDLLVVGLNSDDSIRRLKGTGRPLVPLDERAELLAGLRAVDVVAGFEEDTPRELIVEVRPDVLVKGGDWAPDQIVGRAEVEATGGRVEILPLVEGLSTTDLARRIRGG